MDNDLSKLQIELKALNEQINKAFIILCKALEDSIKLSVLIKSIRENEKGNKGL